MMMTAMISAPPATYINDVLRKYKNVSQYDVTEFKSLSL